LPVFQVVKQAGLTGSTSEALRMIEQGAVRLNGERVEDRGVVLAPGQTVVLQVGKRKFASVVLS
jgi:tyrosyl-tRNA synthetase